MPNQGSAARAGTIPGSSLLNCNLEMGENPARLLDLKTVMIPVTNSTV